MSLEEFEENTNEPSDYVLVFDTETTIDAAQNLIIGTYQVYRGQQLHKKGIFYDPIMLKKRQGGELKIIQAYVDKHNNKCTTGNERLRILTVKDFIEYIFYDYGYKLRGTIVGINLAFDISRLAIDHSQLSFGSDLFRGGFTLKLSENRDRARIQIRHISSKLSFFQFSDLPGNAIKREAGEKIPIRRGFFTDVRTLAAALTAKAHTLGSLANALKTDTRKAHVDKYGDILTPKDIEYALQDTQVTWECYQKLLDLFYQHNLSTCSHKIYSEASLGKAYLRKMGILSWQKLQPDYPKEMIGIIMSTYFGGRAEVHIRRQVTQIMYCDFLSMYPTVCTLMGLWDFVIANGIQERDTTVETRDFLERVTLDDLNDEKIWRNLRVLVQMQPDKDIFPVRAQYQSDDPFTIGLNYLSHDEPLWFTLADCIASKLLTGKTPQIIKAISFEPLDAQKKLRPINGILGYRDYVVDPYEGSFFARLIELRTEFKKQGKKNEEQALKILANATSYGIFVELVDIKVNTKEKIIVFGNDEKPFLDFNKKYEKPGTYFHPLLGTLITGAARLLLAMAERRAINAGLDWVFCDTDSMAFAKPHGMNDQDFYQRVEIICAEFKQLSPYKGKPSLLKIEDENYQQDNKGKIIEGEQEPLFCFAVSAKRYALFNLREEKRSHIRKVSAHGLGHLRDPYLSNKKVSVAEGITNMDNDDEQEKDEIAKVKPWHKDFWRCIVDAALNGHINEPDYQSVKGLQKHAASIFSASTPEQEGWFKKHNKGKDRYDCVRPFNFLLVFKEKPFSGLADQPTPQAENTTKKKLPLFPIAPFDRDLSIAANNCFDRNDPTRKIVPEELATYHEDRGQYHLHPETKFRDGDYRMSSVTQRRHIKPTASVKSPALILIGKEANELEEQIVLGSDADKQKKHPNYVKHSALTLELIQTAVRVHGLRELAREAEISANELVKINKGEVKHLRPDTIDKLDKAITRLNQALHESKELLYLMQHEADEIGKSKFARHINHSLSGIKRALLKNKLPKQLRTKLKSYFMKKKARK